MDYSIVYYMAGILIGIGMGNYFGLLILYCKDKKAVRRKKRKKKAEKKSLLNRIKNPDYQISSHGREHTAAERQKKEEAAYRILKRRKEDGDDKSCD